MTKSCSFNEDSSQFISVSSVMQKRTMSGSLKLSKCVYRTMTPCCIRGSTGSGVQLTPLFHFVIIRYTLMKLNNKVYILLFNTVM